MDRRHALRLGAAWLAAPHVAHGQARKLRIAFLGGTAPDPSTQKLAIEPFRLALRDLGWVEGQNLEIAYRWAEGQPARLPALAAELLALNPDVLVAMGPAPGMAAKRATATVPVVAVAVDNPVEMGLVADFARPGANVTGISSFGSELVAKRLQLLKELVPTLRRAAVLLNPATASRAAVDDNLRKFERVLGISVQTYAAGSAEQFEPAFAAMARDRVEGVLVFADATFWTDRSLLHGLVTKYRLPSIWGGRSYLDGGGLASYQSDFPAIFRRAAAMVDRLAKGAKPEVTPFEQATKLELVINLKSAQALGLTVPQSLLVSADELIP